MRILFYDVSTPRPYAGCSLRNEALGGTEATVIRIAEGLAPYHRIFVAQHGRQDDCVDAGVHYISLHAAQRLEIQQAFDVVVLLRDDKFLTAVAHQFRTAKLYFWMHNVPSRNLFHVKARLIKYGFDIIAVSHFLRDLIEERLQGKWYQRLFEDNQNVFPTIKVHVLYNPIADGLKPDQTAWLPHKLIFLSSPQKGLTQTLQLFQCILKKFPDYELHIANPGYREMEITALPQVNILGKLPHHAVMQHVRESFCVFYPQSIRVETFGLIYAEANAVGTPVLAHQFGAAAEVLSDPDQLLNGRKAANILSKLVAWRAHRPVVQGKEAFRLTQVVQSWRHLLEGSSESDTFKLS